MKKLILFVVAVAAALTLTAGHACANTAATAPATSDNAAPANPKAKPGAMVTAGNARFTVLTDRLIRMEWAEDGQFEDRASLAIINRDLPVPAFKATKQGGGVIISTGKLTLEYKG